MKSIWTKAGSNLAEFFVSLHKESLRRGVGDDEFGMAITNSIIIGKMADLIAAMKEKFILLVEKNIAVVTESFTKDSFFSEIGPIKLSWSGSFRDWVLRVAPDVIPAFQGALTKSQLNKHHMEDSEILKELGVTPFTIASLLAIICTLLIKQGHGESGTFLADGYSNVFYVQLSGRVVAVSVIWDVKDPKWNLDAFDLEGGGCFVGDVVFTC